MKQVVVQDRQTIYDIAIQEYGSVMGLALLFKDNPSINGFTATLATGSIVVIKSAPIDEKAVKYYVQNDIKPVSLTGNDFNPSDFNESDFN